jgi:photosystem II stability/assembly factor-like uncharacterized protein
MRILGGTENRHTVRCFSRFVFLVLLMGASAGSFLGSASIAMRPIVDIFFLSSRQGWIVAKDGNREFLFRTADEGRHWSITALNVPIAKMFFLDSKRGFAVAIAGNKFSLVGTTDGGADWKELCSIPELSTNRTILTSLTFNDFGGGWIVGTRSKGLSEVIEVNTAECTVKKILPLSGRFGLSGAIFGDLKSGEIWLVGSDSILYSHNSGKSWKPQVKRNTLREASTFNAGQALGNGTAFVVGAATGGTIYRTTDHGLHWDLVAGSPEARWFTDVYFWDSGHGCAVGASRTLFCTSDGGNTWEGRQVLPKSREDMAFMDNVFTRIAFSENGAHGWVVASGGFLFHSDDNGNTWHALDLFATSGQRGTDGTFPSKRVEHR